MTRLPAFSIPSAAGLAVIRRPPATEAAFVRTESPNRDRVGRSDLVISCQAFGMFSIPSHRSRKKIGAETMKSTKEIRNSVPRNQRTANRIQQITGMAMSIRTSGKSVTRLEGSGSLISRNSVTGIDIHTVQQRLRGAFGSLAKETGIAPSLTLQALQECLEAHRALGQGRSELEASARERFAKMKLRLGNRRPCVVKLNAAATKARPALFALQVDEPLSTVPSGQRIVR